MSPPFAATHRLYRQVERAVSAFLFLLSFPLILIRIRFIDPAHAQLTGGAAAWYNIAGTGSRTVPTDIPDGAALKNEIGGL